MNNLLKNLLQVLALVLISVTAIGQTGEIRIRFIGNCGLHMSDGTRNVYVDFPYKSGAYGYMEYDKSELDSVKDNSIFLFTHKHNDHHSGKLVRKLSGKDYGPRNKRGIEKLNQVSQDFQVQTFNNKHKFSFKHNSYLITWHGKKIFLSGDTETAETIANLGGLDWAFVPYWILSDANKRNIKIDAKKFGLYHLYTNQKIDGEIPDKIELMDKQGKVMTIGY